MANYCDNKAFITGAKEELERFERFTEGHKIFTPSFDAIKFATSFGYEDLGSRWIDFYLDGEINEEFFIIAGDSAWNAPYNFYKILSEQFPKLDIVVDFSEPGMNFGGWFEFSNGELIDEVFMDYWEYLVTRDEDGAIDLFIEYEAESYENLQDIIDNADILNHVSNPEEVLKLIKKDWKITD